MPGLQNGKPIIRICIGFIIPGIIPYIGMQINVRRVSLMIVMLQRTR